MIACEWGILFGLLSRTQLLVANNWKIQLMDCTKWIHNHQLTDIIVLCVLFVFIYLFFGGRGGGGRGGGGERLSGKLPEFDIRILLLK